MEANNKMREALQQAKVAILAARKKMGVDNPIILEIIDAALAAPLRNCEVGTEVEQARRFNDYCHKQGNSCSVGRSKGACPMFKGYKVDCAIVWSQSLYEKGESDEQK